MFLDTEKEIILSGGLREITVYLSDILGMKIFLTYRGRVKGDSAVFIISLNTYFIKSNYFRYPIMPCFTQRLNYMF